MASVALRIKNNNNNNPQNFLAKPCAIWLTRALWPHLRPLPDQSLIGRSHWLLVNFFALTIISQHHRAFAHTVPPDLPFDFSSTVTTSGQSSLTSPTTYIPIQHRKSWYYEPLLCNIVTLAFYFCVILCVTLLIHYTIHESEDYNLQQLS